MSKTSQKALGASLEKGSRARAFEPQNPKEKDTALNLSGVYQIGKILSNLQLTGS